MLVDSLRLRELLQLELERSKANDKEAMTKDALSRAIGGGDSVVSSWMRGVHYIRDHSPVRLAEYFGISIEELRSLMQDDAYEADLLRRLAERLQVDVESLKQRLRLNIPTSSGPKQKSPSKRTEATKSETSAEPEPDSEPEQNTPPEPTIAITPAPVAITNVDVVDMLRQARGFLNGAADASTKTKVYEAIIDGKLTFVLSE